MGPVANGQALAADALGARDAGMAPVVRHRITRRRRARLASAWLRTLVAATPVIAGIVVLSPEADRPAPHPFDPVVTSAITPRTPAASELDWEAVPRSAPTLALLGRDWQGRTTASSVRRHAATGAREDAIAAGRFEDGGPHVQVTVTGEPGGGESLYLVLARRAAAAGRAVTKVVLAAPVPTKFGLAQTAALVLESAGQQRACTGFRVLRIEPATRLEGWLCGPGGRAPQDAELACALSDLALASPAEEPALKATFVEAERNRVMGCRAEDRAALGPPRRPQGR